MSGYNRYDSRDQAGSGKQCRSMVQIRRARVYLSAKERNLFSEFRQILNNERKTNSKKPEEKAKNLWKKKKKNDTKRPPLNKKIHSSESSSDQEEEISSSSHSSDEEESHLQDDKKTFPTKNTRSSQKIQKNTTRNYISTTSKYESALDNLLIHKKSTHTPIEADDILRLYDNVLSSDDSNHHDNDSDTIYSDNDSDTSSVKSDQVDVTEIEEYLPGNGKSLWKNDSLSSYGSLFPIPLFVLSRLNNDGIMWSYIKEEIQHVYDRLSNEEKVEIWGKKFVKNNKNKNLNNSFDNIFYEENSEVLLCLLNKMNIEESFSSRYTILNKEFQPRLRITSLIQQQIVPPWLSINFIPVKKNLRPFIPHLFQVNGCSFLRYTIPFPLPPHHKAIPNARVPPGGPFIYPPPPPPGSNTSSYAYHHHLPPHHPLNILHKAHIATTPTGSNPPVATTPPTNTTATLPNGKAMNNIIQSLFPNSVPLLGHMKAITSNLGKTVNNQIPLHYGGSGNGKAGLIPTKGMKSPFSTTVAAPSIASSAGTTTPSLLPLHVPPSGTPIGSNTTTSTSNVATPNNNNANIQTARIPPYAYIHRKNYPPGGKAINSASGNITSGQYRYPLTPSNVPLPMSLNKASEKGGRDVMKKKEGNIGSTVNPSAMDLTHYNMYHYSFKKPFHDSFDSSNPYGAIVNTIENATNTNDSNELSNSDTIATANTAVNNSIINNSAIKNMTIRKRSRLTIHYPAFALGGDKLIYLKPQIAESLSTSFLSNVPTLSTLISNTPIGKLSLAVANNIREEIIDRTMVSMNRFTEFHQKHVLGQIDINTVLAMAITGGPLECERDALSSSTYGKDVSVALKTLTDYIEMYVSHHLSQPLPKKRKLMNIGDKFIQHTKKIFSPQQQKEIMHKINYGRTQGVSSPVMEEPVSLQSKTEEALSSVKEEKVYRMENTEAVSCSLSDDAVVAQQERMQLVKKELEEGEKDIIDNVEAKVHLTQAYNHGTGNNTLGNVVIEHTLRDGSMNSSVIIEEDNNINDSDIDMNEAEEDENEETAEDYANRIHQSLIGLSAHLYELHKAAMTAAEAFANRSNTQLGIGVWNNGKLSTRQSVVNRLYDSHSHSFKGIEACLSKAVLDTMTAYNSPLLLNTTSHYAVNNMMVPEKKQSAMNHPKTEMSLNRRVKHPQS